MQQSSSHCFPTQPKPKNAPTPSIPHLFFHHFIHITTQFRQNYSHHPNSVILSLVIFLISKYHQLIDQGRPTASYSLPKCRTRHNLLCWTLNCINIFMHIHTLRSCSEEIPCIYVFSMPLLHTLRPLSPLHIAGPPMCLSGYRKLAQKRSIWL